MLCGSLDGRSLGENVCSVAQSCSTLCDPVDYLVRLHGLLLEPAKLLYPWNFPNKNTGVGCHFLLRGSSPSRDWTWVSCISLSSRQIPLCHLGAPCGRMDTYICIRMAESLCCPPETITTLLIGYMPIENKKFMKRELFYNRRINSMFVCWWDSFCRDMMPIFVYHPEAVCALY